MKEHKLAMQHSPRESILAEGREGGRREGERGLAREQGKERQGARERDGGGEVRELERTCP